MSQRYATIWAFYNDKVVVLKRPVQGRENRLDRYMRNANVAYRATYFAIKYCGTYRCYCQQHDRMLAEFSDIDAMLMWLTLKGTEK